MIKMKRRRPASFNDLGFPERRCRWWQKSHRELEPLSTHWRRRAVIVERYDGHIAEPNGTTNAAHLVRTALPCVMQSGKSRPVASPNRAATTCCFCVVSATSFRTPIVTVVR